MRGEQNVSHLAAVVLPWDFSPLCDAGQKMRRKYSLAAEESQQESLKSWVLNDVQISIVSQSSSLLYSFCWDSTQLGQPSFWRLILRPLARILPARCTGSESTQANPASQSARQSNYRKMAITKIHFHSVNKRLMKLINGMANGQNINYYQQ